MIRVRVGSHTPANEVLMRTPPGQMSSLLLYQQTVEPHKVLAATTILYDMLRAFVPDTLLS